MRTDARVVVARIPAGQPLELTQSVIALFGTVLDDCHIAPGNGADCAADIVGGEGLPDGDIVKRLRRATRKLGKTLPRPVPEDEADDTFAEDPLRFNAMRATETGIAFGLGGATEAARAFAAELLAVFIPALDEAGAENYLSWDAPNTKTGETYSVIFVKPNGLTPHQARQRADAEAERPRELCKANNIDPDLPRTSERNDTDA
ncbi:hypothetical protein [Lentzea sp. NPDC092896]|uniref:hypothetical protein n=1 Tax=Lentzea sp. NPDC092896 TaxID=3364127 RepID=UPI00382398EF